MRPDVIAAALAVLIAGGGPAAYAAYQRRAARRAARARWTEPVFRGRDRAALGRYHALLPDERTTDALDARTWDDLTLDAVFAQVDRAVGAPGQQVLHHWLRAPAQDAAPLAEREALFQAFADGPALRDAVFDAAAPLGVRGAEQVTELVWGAPAPAPRALALVWLLPGALALCLAASLVVPQALAGVLLVAVAGLVARAALRPRLHAVLEPVRAVWALCAAARRLAAHPAVVASPALASQREALAAAAPTLRPVERAARWLALDGDEAGALAGVANALFSVDLLVLARLSRALGGRRAAPRRAALQAAFDAVGTLDAARAVASWRASLGDAWVRPALGGARTAMLGVRHPLVDGAVPNDYAPDAPGLLVTGSNMAGKSTYVRSVGLAAVLAQSLHTVPATSYAAPFLRVRASIGRQDDVLAGKSYYLAEVESVLGLLGEARRAAADGRPALLLLDELFRGTNAVERVAGGAAVLAALAEPPTLVIAATHDLELVELLAPAYVPCHFRETVAPGGLAFDYVLRPGPSTTRNAIALLAEMGAPRAVVDSALATAAALTARRRQPGGEGDALTSARR